MAILWAMFAAILNIMPSKTLIHKWKTTVWLSRCPLTSNYIKIFAKSIFYNDYLFFCGHLGRHLEFLKTLKGAKPAPDEILKTNVSPLRKYQNIYYTLPCHVRLKYIKYLPDYMWYEVFKNCTSLQWYEIVVVRGLRHPFGDLWV